MANEPPAAAAGRLADRLRELRERGFDRRLTQTELGQAFTEDVGGAASAATISNWENSASGRKVPSARIEGYARLFCTPRSLPDEGGVQMLEPSGLTAEEHDRLERLREELLELREGTMGGQEVPGAAQSMWHFPDGLSITLACGRLPPENLPPHASRGEVDYVRFAELADLDTLIDIYGAVKSYNPTSRVTIMAAEDLTPRDVANHLVLIGGLAWKAAKRWFERVYPLKDFPEPVDRGDGDVIPVRLRDGRERVCKYTRADEELVEDVGIFARGPNPTAPRRTLSICSGITTRGVHGAAKCFIDKEMKQRNERYLHSPRFPAGSTYCIVMRVPVVNESPLTPDLSRADNLLYEWCDDPSFEAE
jgi:hypothetical protein